MSRVVDDKQAKGKRAVSEYNASIKHAQRANAMARDAQEYKNDYNKEKYRLDNWDRIMSTQPIYIAVFIFVIVAVVEYLISKEIYREFLDSAPWVVAIGFFIVGVFISDLLAYKVIDSKRKWKEFEIRIDPNSKTITDDELAMKINKHAKSYFILGLIIAVLLITAIFFLSMSRVTNELAAGLRVDAFGIMDIMPVILYIVELLVGIFIVYFFRRMGLGLKVKKLYKKFSEAVRVCGEETQKSVKKYEDAEREDFDPVASAVANDIHEVFYRYYSKNLQKEEDYIDFSEPITDGIVFELVYENGEPLKEIKHLTVITNYKYTAVTSTNEIGIAVIEFEKTFPQDSIRHIFVRNAANDKEFYRIDSCNYDLNFVNKENPIKLFIN